MSSPLVVLGPIALYAALVLPDLLALLPALARPELPAIAQRRAVELLGIEIPGRAVVVIGDTPADIQCGRGIGARAIGVATGRYDAATLAAHGAAAVFENLADTSAVVQAIVGDAG